MDAIHSNPLFDQLKLTPVFHCREVYPLNVLLFRMIHRKSLTILDIFKASVSEYYSLQWIVSVVREADLYGSVTILFSIMNYLAYFSIKCHRVILSQKKISAQLLAKSDPDCVL